ncbi:hypothetical protein O181_019346 [Austropuccinia psidii MF-1]|uniref:CCHC-type domain-containing protein n=1 Tax=Austropuccinia psidii MF-1 TaxID=1389203 RepID=A0A9Q3CBC7_9BASI|nr:hypothetical protein [Austropuccinia psidii MF-1]
MLVGNCIDSPRPNLQIILFLRKTFAVLKRLKVDADELEGLLAQAVCHTPPSLSRASFDQLITASILATNVEKPSATAVGQMIIKETVKQDGRSRHTSPEAHCSAEFNPQAPSSSFPSSALAITEFQVEPSVWKPPEHLIKRFGNTCYQCGKKGHWRADCQMIQKRPAPIQLVAPTLQTPEHFQSKEFSLENFVKKV